MKPSITPEEILAQWNNNKQETNRNIRALVIAGCSVASIHEIIRAPVIGYRFNRITGERKGTGMRWAKLLTSQGGPVEHICGYWGGAPADNNGGNRIATYMGGIIFQDQKTKTGNLASEWVGLHKALYGSTRTTVAGLTGNEFIHIDSEKVTTEKIIV